MSTPHTLLSAALLIAASALWAAPAHAQDDDYEDKKLTDTLSGSAKAASERARQKKLAEKEKAEAKAVALYPAATRVEPGLKGTLKGSKALQEMLVTYDAKQYASTIQLAEALVAAPDANAYDRAFAYQLAANAAADNKNNAQAATYFRKALDANGLDNNGHYQVMYNLAVTEYGLGRNSDALKTLDTFLRETKADKPEYSSLRAALLAATGRSADAAALYTQLLAKNPNDKNTLMNVVALLQQAKQHDKARALLLDAQKRGLLTEAREYRALYVGYINDGQPKEALALIDAGLAKNILKPSSELAKDLMVIGQAAYAAKDSKLAIEMFKRAAAMASDGEAALNLAKVYSNAGRLADAKQAAQLALAKGVKRPEEAKKILGKAAK